MQKLIISLGRRYVQYVNRSHRRTGTLWDSRYKSSLIQAETYLLACQRYIELNPVRAAMVDDPAHYRWTSYRANALGQADARLTPHSLYLALGKSDKERQAAYRALFRAPLDRAAIDDIRLALNQSQPLGNERFYAKIEKLTGTRREARPRGQRRLFLETVHADAFGPMAHRNHLFADVNPPDQVGLFSLEFRYDGIFRLRLIT